jgi:predicted dehydrogenase
MAIRYRAGIIGAGQIGPMHAVGYHGVDSVDLVALTEPNERVRTAIQEKYSIPRGYSDFREMLDCEHLDLVRIVVNAQA